MIVPENNLESKYGRSNDGPFICVTTRDEGGSIIGIDDVGDALSQLSSTLLFFLPCSFLLCILDVAEMLHFSVNESTSALSSTRTTLSRMVQPFHGPRSRMVPEVRELCPSCTPSVSGADHVLHRFNLGMHVILLVIILVLLNIQLSSTLLFLLSCSLFVCILDLAEISARLRSRAQARLPQCLLTDMKCLVHFWMKANSCSSIVKASSMHGDRHGVLDAFQDKSGYILEHKQSFLNACGQT